MILKNVKFNELRVCVRVRGNLVFLKPLKLLAYRRYRLRRLGVKPATRSTFAKPCKVKIKVQFCKKNFIVFIHTLLPYSQKA